MNHFKKIFVNVLTIIRFALIPLIFLIDNQVILFLFVNFLFITDFLDGYFARRLEVTSTTGAVLDLIADKTLVILLLSLAFYQGMISFLLYFLIVFREVYSMITRFRYYKREHELIQASFVGKLKTTFQFISLSMMMLNIPGYKIMLWIVVGLSYYSFLSYFKISKGEK